MAENTEDTSTAAAPAVDREVTLLRLYIKDLSFEAPNSPEMLKALETEPKVEMNLKNRHHRVDGDEYEVALVVSVRATLNDRTLYVLEIDQAALFKITGYDDHDEFMHLIGSYCPSTLFPYVREVVSTVIGQGGFPRVLLQPISFDAIYAQSKENSPATNTPPSTLN